MDLILGLLLGASLTYLTSYYFQRKKSLHKIENQSVILIEKIKSVCKLITVEGDFAEVYHFEDTKNHMLNLISSKKKAILLIKAKVHLGFDLSQIKLQANNQSQEIVLTQFPKPQVLSIESDINYYDKKEGLFNKFNSKDLTQLQQSAKQFILNKIPESGLMETANKEALETILIIEKLIETSGWKLNYKAFNFNEQNKLN
ncbi:MAG: DUF4230 domain-containing protein [Lutibacter sp.]